MLYSAAAGNTPFGDGDEEYPQLHSRAPAIASERTRLPRALSGVIDASLEPGPSRALDRMTRFVDDLLLLARAERADFLSRTPTSGRSRGAWPPRVSQGTGYRAETRTRGSRRQAGRASLRDPRRLD